MAVDGPRGYLTTSGILAFNVKLRPLCMGSRVGRRGKFVAGLLEKAVGDQGVERGNNKPMVKLNIPKGTHPGLDMVEVGWGSTSHCMRWKPGSIFLLMPSCASCLTPMV
ncbi:hypothetical protein E1A91_A08G085500v1 [Gossypium mustelinum]|uniref:Uncharacterized protein n=1 Tax=Gossypium mustelinum TaxID=34275 RepID=A0A5D2Y6T4_GOSMU|nr:hypothetical protein E1A91_A08G085500v1 [Gossypium mustelinum]